MLQYFSKFPKPYSPNSPLPIWYKKNVFFPIMYILLSLTSPYDTSSTSNWAYTPDHILVCHPTCYIISICHWGYHSVRTAQTKAYQSPLPFSVHTISGSATCHLCHQPTLRKNELSHRRTQSQGISSYHIYPSNI